MSLRSQLAIVVVAMAAGAAGLWAGHAWFGLNPPPGSVAIGAPAIEFQLPTLDGASATRASYSGRVQVINFWAPWCAPCRREIPLLQALREEFGSDRVEVLGIALDEPEAVRKYVGEIGIDYPILLASMGDFALMRAYGNDRDALPFTVIVDTAGRVHARKLGEYHEADLRADIESALADGGRSPM